MTPEPKGAPRKVEIVAPHDLAAEETVLAEMILSAIGRAAVREVVRAEDFYRPSHGHIFEAICALDDLGEGIDPITVLDQLRRVGLAGGIELGDLIALYANGLASETSARAHAGIVAEAGRKRRLAGYGLDVTTRALDPTQTSESTFQEAEAALVAAQADFEGQDQVVTAGAGIALVEEAAKIAAANGSTGLVGLATGHRDLDHRLRGLAPGALVVVGARPSMGKTAWGLGAALHNGLHDVPTLFVSAEMSALEIFGRVASMVTDIPGEDIRLGRLSERQWARLERARQALGSAPFQIMDKAAATPGEVRLKARAMKVQRGLGLVVVDHLGLLTPRATRERRELEVAETAWLLKTMARDLGCVVIALSQLNRNLEARADKRPVLSDLRESGAIEQHADVVLFLYRDEYYNPASPDRGTAEVIIAKNRNGPTGTSRLAWLPTLARFGDLAPEPVF
jgi:replicative DNA helicase